MQKKYFFLVPLIILVSVFPAAGSLLKISSGAPVFIGEQNLDISSGLQGCRIIGWWKNSSERAGPPDRNITIIRTLEESTIAFRYTMDPAIYTGYTGTWYCVDKQPPRVVFNVTKPELSVRFWDLDKDEDITGRLIPLDTNISYRITTNLDQALQYRFRPEITPQDSFFTVTLTDPHGKELHNLYSGSYGRKDTLIIPFDTVPYIAASPYFWKNGGVWDPESRNAQGEYLYPPGTYTITVAQNLNNMADLYSGDQDGLLFSSATVTFVKPESAPVPATPSGTISPRDRSPAATPVPSISLETSLPGTPAVQTRTTYAPLPSWAVFTALAAAVVLAVRRHR